MRTFSDKENGMCVKRDFFIVNMKKEMKLLESFELN